MAKTWTRTLMAMVVLLASLLIGNFIGQGVGSILGLTGILSPIVAGFSPLGLTAGVIIAVPFEYYILVYLGRRTKTVQIG